jgi:gamma-glutamyltranspeptidase/glutathione hydrolase
MKKDRFNNLHKESDADTTSFVVADKWGNGVSLIHSLSDMMGSGVVAGNTGILLNNRAGRGFTLEEGHPNCLEPKKRTMSTLMPYIITKDNSPYLLGNTVGGDKQPQWNMQVIANVMDFAMNIEQAVSAPRWYSFPGTDPATFENEFMLYMEEGISPYVCSELHRRGHDIEVVGPFEGGGDQQLIRMEKGILIGASDPRADGMALGF